MTPVGHRFNFFFHVSNLKKKGRKFIEIISNTETFGRYKQTHERQLIIKNIKSKSLKAMSGGINVSYSSQNKNPNPKSKRRVSDYKVIKVK